MTSQADQSTTFESLGHQLGVRRIFTVLQEVREEGGHPLDRPVCQAAAVAVLSNPWSGTGVDQDLGERTRDVAPVLAKLLTDRLLVALGGKDAIQTFGKAALVGTDGELEHAAALIHTPYFGNLVRELLGGTAIICFTDGRSEPGPDLKVPLWHKTTAGLRDYYQTIDLHLPDAPHPDEICVIAAASDGPRPFPRIGDRQTDPDVDTTILKGLLS